MLRITRCLASAAVLAVLAAGCDRAAPTATVPERPAARSATLNQAPVPVVNLTVLRQYCENGSCGYEYQYDSYQSYDPDGSIVSQEWAIQGSPITTAPTWTLIALRAYEGCAGTTRGTLTVTDDQGASSTVCFGFTEL